jgi:hypothetical protein
MSYYDPDEDQPWWVNAIGIMILLVILWDQWEKHKEGIQRVIEAAFR